MPDPIYVRPNDAKDAFGVSRSTIYQWAKAGHITIHKRGEAHLATVQRCCIASNPVAETVLGHQIGNRVERSYARSDMLEPRRIALEAWSRYVTGAGANVVQIAGQKT